MKIKLLLILSVLLVEICACQKDDFSSTAIEDISGKWFQERFWEDNLILREVYDFKYDQTFEIIKSVINSHTKEIKGYVTKETGHYKFKGDSLILQDIKLYSVNTHTYKELAELEFITTYTRRSYKVVYNTNKNILTLKFNCPINADCVPDPRLTRVKN